MDTKAFKLYNKEDIEILNDGISVRNNFLNKQKIADTFNELILLNTFIEEQSSSYGD